MGRWREGGGMGAGLGAQLVVAFGGQDDQLSAARAQLLHLRSAAPPRVARRSRRQRAELQMISCPQQFKTHFVCNCRPSSLGLQQVHGILKSHHNDCRMICCE